MLNFTEIDSFKKPFKKYYIFFPQCNLGIDNYKQNGLQSTIFNLHELILIIDCSQLQPFTKKSFLKVLWGMGSIIYKISIQNSTLVVILISLFPYQKSIWEKYTIWQFCFTHTHKKPFKWHWE